MSVIRTRGAQNDELFWMRHRQVAQQDLVGQRENRGVSADAERECENRDGGEAWRFAEHAKGEAQILEQCIEERKAAVFAIAFSGLFEATEVQERLVAGFLTAHALSDVALDGHVQVRTQFSVEVAVELVAMEKGAQAMGELEKPGNHFVATPLGYFVLSCHSFLVNLHRKASSV